MLPDRDDGLAPCTLTLRTLFEDGRVFLGIYHGLEGDNVHTDTSDRDPLAAVSLTPDECNALARELLRRASRLRHERRAKGRRHAR